MAVLVFAFLFIGERPSVTSILGIGLSLMDIVILVVGDPQFSWHLGGYLLGDVRIMGAVITAALYMVSARDLLTLLQVCGGIFVLTAVRLTNLSGLKTHGRIAAEVA